MIKHIVSISGGVPSALTAYRVIQRYGKNNVTLLFADTTVEHADNYRFLDDIEAWLGLPITHLKDGRTPIDLMREAGFIFNDAIATCTRDLKLKVIQRYVEELQGQGHDVVMYIGYDLKDRAKGRLTATTRNWSERGVTVEYPLIEWLPVALDVQDEFKRLSGITIPVMYRRGYKHANCKGACVKQGFGDWWRTFNYDRDTYMEYEAFERDMRKVQALRCILIRTVINSWLDFEYTPEELASELDELGGLEIHSFLRRKLLNGDHESKTLEELRIERTHANGQLRLFEFEDDSNVCGIECGIG